jgi:hypothetical protein
MWLVRHFDDNLISNFSHDEEEIPHRTSVILELVIIIVETLQQPIL